MLITRLLNVYLTAPFMFALFSHPYKPIDSMQYRCQNVNKQYVLFIYVWHSLHPTDCFINYVLFVYHFIKYNVYFWKFETVGAGSIVGQTGRKKTDTSPHLQNENIPMVDLPNDSDSPDSGKSKRGQIKFRIRTRKKCSQEVKKLTN